MSGAGSGPQEGEKLNLGSHEEQYNESRRAGESQSRA